MREWKDKTIRVEHLIERVDVDEREVEGVGESDIWYMTESYQGMTVSSWTQTAQGKVTQICTKGTCRTHNIIKEFSDNKPKMAARSWACARCIRIQTAARGRIESKQNYKAELPKRIMAFSRALRKRHPEFNSRKSRLDNDIIINGRQWNVNNDDTRKKINIVGYEFNLHVDTFYSQDDNDGEDRVRFTVQDISPMFDEHFRDHGHKGGVKDINQ